MPSCPLLSCTLTSASAEAEAEIVLPRYARVNTLLTSLAEVVKELEHEGWCVKEAGEDCLKKK